MVKDQSLSHAGKACMPVHARRIYRDVHRVAICSCPTIPIHYIYHVLFLYILHVGVSGTWAAYNQFLFGFRYHNPNLSFNQTTIVGKRW